jgi:hypothetical protein
MASAGRIALLLLSVLIGALLALALSAHAATINFPRGTTGVTLAIENAIDCNDGSALVCLTTLPVQRAYLIALGPDGTFVTAAYRVLLNRPVDIGGLSYYTNRLAGGTITRDGIVDEIVSSPEYRGMHP